MMSGDNDKVFSDAMSDVVPLKYEPRVDLSRKSALDKDSSLEHRRRAAAEMPETDLNVLSNTGDSAAGCLVGALLQAHRRTKRCVS